jgi:Putative adhesin
LKKEITVKSFILPVLLAAFALSNSSAMGRESYQGSFERTLTVSGPADLEVFTHSGDVTLHTGGAGKIVISGKIHVGDRWLSGGHKEDVAHLESNPPIHQDGSHVKIDYVSLHDISIDYDVTLPADSTVRAESGSGNLTVDGLQNGFEGRTGSGDVRLDHLAGTMRVQSGSGNITARALAGPFDLNASSGDIRVEQTSAGDVKAHTGSGNIEIRGVDGSARAETGSGNIEIEGKPSGSWYVKAGSGNADLRLPSDAGFDLDVSTGSGTITVDHPLATTIQGRVQSPQKSVNGKVHGGGPGITVHTGSGDIGIR